MLNAINECISNAATQKTGCLFIANFKKKGQVLQKQVQILHDQWL
jgi:hypothetical protein